MMMMTELEKGAEDVEAVMEMTRREEELLRSVQSFFRGSLISSSVMPYFVGSLASSSAMPQRDNFI